VEESGTRVEVGWGEGRELGCIIWKAKIHNLYSCVIVLGCKFGFLSGIFLQILISEK
jgi:hypothetical protein